jgi:ribosomal protein S18 acetylase RimI-like enzyme
MSSSGVLLANRSEPQPPTCRDTSDVEVRLASSPEEADAAAALLVGQYWTQDFSLALMARAHLGSQAWVIACERVGASDANREQRDHRIVGSARAVSDGARFAWIMDVVVAPERRGKGIGQALVLGLLEHPALRGVAYIGLRTRDAHGLYTKFGFVSEPGSPVQMGLKRVQP